jgi:hypothetical protein
MAKKTFILHDETVNTHGFRMLTGGANLSVFGSNPVMLLNHDDWAMPIGRWENIRVEGTQILADAVFDEKDERALQVSGKVERDFIRAASIGAWVDEASEDDFLKMQGQSGPTVIRWTAREASICTIGANHNALALYDRKTNRRIDLSDETAIIKLIDGGKQPSMSNQNKSEMLKIKRLLKLQDAASDDALADAVEQVINQRDALQAENVTLKGTNKTLTDRLAVIDGERKTAEDAEAVGLVDAAVKDARIDGTNRQAWLDDFGKDFAGAKVRLASIAKRTPVAPQVQNGKPAAGVTALADMTFAEVLKADRLKELKADNPLYVQKFRDTYGHDPE